MSHFTLSVLSHFFSYLKFKKKIIKKRLEEQVGRERERVSSILPYHIYHIYNLHYAINTLNTYLSQHSQHIPSNYFLSSLYH